MSALRYSLAILASSVFDISLFLSGLYTNYGPIESSAKRSDVIAERANQEAGIWLCQCIFREGNFAVEDSGHSSQEGGG